MVRDRRTRILWFSPTPSLFAQNTVRHNGGGWVASLECLIRTVPEFELGIAFESADRRFQHLENGVHYFPIDANVRLAQKLRRKFGIATECDALIEHARRIISQFDPDLIHVFGSESCFGLLSDLIDIPLIIHMQGSLPAYANARFPPGYGRFDFIRASRGNPLRLYRLFSNDRAFARRAKREEAILRGCRHFMGRTEWDRAICAIFNPEATYDYCSEALRTDFVEETRCWAPRSGAEINLVSTLSNPLYKGADLILKTAEVLRKEMGRGVRWRVFGVSDIAIQQAKTGLQAADWGVELSGVADSDGIRDALLAADMYVHPSYIDNSPNSLCEAQVLGVPVVATNVGGISSLVDPARTGQLVPANDPYMMAWRIAQLKDDQDLGRELSANARTVARNRHAPEQIRADLTAIYRKYKRDAG